MASAFYVALQLREEQPGKRIHFASRRAMRNPLAGVSSLQVLKDGDVGAEAVQAFGQVFVAALNSIDIA